RGPRSRKHPLSDGPGGVSHLVRAEDEPADHDRGDEEHREVGEAAVQQEDQPDDGDDAAVDLTRVVAQKRAEVVADVVAGRQGHGGEDQENRGGDESAEGSFTTAAHASAPSIARTYQRSRRTSPSR